MSDHVLPLRSYYTVFAALIGLTCLTVGVAYIDLGLFGTPVALGIATLKSTLVVLIFMHVRWQSKLTWMFVGAGFLWFLVLVAFTLGDVLTRSDANPTFF